MKRIIVVIAINTWLLVNATSDSFTEELFLKPLDDEKVYAHFHFSTKWDIEITQDTVRHTHLFPRALAEIVEKHNVQELHLSLTAGLWRYERWGYPVENAAPGAELWVWFKSDTLNVDSNWKLFSNSLSGLICASLNFFDATNSISPEYSFRPTGVVNEQFINSSYLRYSSLPREVVCTENLTPWKKLLPCESRSGLASLLNAGHIHNTIYHSLAIQVRPVCRDALCESTSMAVQQSVGLVYDYGILGTRNWSLRRLFGQGLFGACPLAKSSDIYIDTSVNQSKSFTLQPVPDEFIYSIRGGFETKFARYKIPENQMSISVNFNDKQRVLLTSPPPLYASQYLSGYGQERGGINIRIYNNHWSSLDVVVLQNLPWHITVYLHTLKIKSNGEDIKPVSLKYMPGLQRKRPYYLEYVLRLPSRSSTVISMEFEYGFLKWTEYPPDANHGLYIASAVISSVLPLARNFSGLPQDALMVVDSFNASRSGYLVQLRTEPLVITLPTPDFSMPYNAICLASTVVALAFGPLHNITTKRLVRKAVTKEKFLVRMTKKILRLLGKEKK